MSSYTFECPICFDDLSGSQNSVRTNCMHIFHDDCIQDWLGHKATCPSCNKENPLITKMQKLSQRVLEHHQNLVRNIRLYTELKDCVIHVIGKEKIDDEDLRRVNSFIKKGAVLNFDQESILEVAVHEVNLRVDTWNQNRFLRPRLRRRCERILDLFELLITKGALIYTKDIESCALGLLCEKNKLSNLHQQILQLFLYYFPENTTQDKGEILSVFLYRLLQNNPHLNKYHTRFAEIFFRNGARSDEYVVGGRNIMELVEDLYAVNPSTHLRSIGQTVYLDLQGRYS